MNTLESLFENNRKWAKNICEQQPGFFKQLSLQQKPKYLWIGCADSRVPPNQIIGLPPGEVFVHRNIANVVVHTDLNCLSVIQYAVKVLKIEHIIVAGHYGCGGVAAAVATQERGEEHGLIDHWLRHIRDVYRIYHDELQGISDFGARCQRLCELNVVEQAANVAGVIPQAWPHSLYIHGWIYSLKDGILHDLDITESSEGKNGTKNLVHDLQ